MTQINRSEYFGGGNYNDDPWQQMPPPTKKWLVYKGHEPFDFEPSRAILLWIFDETNGHTRHDADKYCDERESVYGDGYCWIDEITIHYRS